MHEENSSSASADILGTLLHIEWASSGILKVSLVEGPSFFIREEYLQGIDASTLQSGMVLCGEVADSFLQAGRQFLAERDALSYLSRAEQSRFNLSVKLRRKGHDAIDINAALDWLEERKWLSDSRFAEAWLRNRSINRPEGRFRLLAELRSRGIAAEIAESAVAELLTESGEEERCFRAVEKFRSRGRDGEKLFISLHRAGFSHRMISRCLGQRKE